ncbi:hypothetical protein CAC42_1225 [Sphaceloma murrayae]|uniref:Cutinase n=1 Tax=Sphaceloma murrayae TaxID=2082308 RepID=A0A2K1R2D0_9PEZI|nr:hypothetical protein CAC42_1225 [Sphaceloma murrayae]
MKFNLALLGLAGLAAANPIPEAVPEVQPEAAPALEARQFSGSTANELVNGACRRITFIWARGSTEPGNLGSTLGPDVCSGLKSRFGSTNVACQGVGGPYTAALGDNALPQGTTSAAIGEAVRLYNLAASRCPETLIVGGGYSQGGAVTHGLARQLSATVRGRVRGLLTFGDTRNQQDGGRIPPFPASQTRIICTPLDPICNGQLIVTLAHLSYGDDVPTGVNFLAGRINA